MNQSLDARKLLDAYARAANAKDVDAFMSLYHPDVRIFDTWGQWSHDGAAAWRKVVEDVVVIPGDEIASVHAFPSYAGVSAAGASS